MNAANPLETPQTAASDQRSYEPSMEEILASIRRIISDDQVPPKRSTPRDIPALRAETREAPSAAGSEAAAAHLLHAETKPYLASVAREVASEEEDNDVGFERPTSMAAHGHVAAPQHPSIAALPSEAPAAMASPLQAEPSVEQRSALPPTSGHPTISRSTQSVEAASGADIRRDDGVGLRGDPAKTEGTSSGAKLFSAETNQSVASAFNVLAATRLADNSEELLDLVREMIRPLLRTWLDDNLPSMVERMVRAEIERVARGRR